MTAPSAGQQLSPCGRCSGRNAPVTLGARMKGEPSTLGNEPRTR
jgi:hypothetical protein